MTAGRNEVAPSAGERGLPVALGVALNATVFASGAAVMVVEIMGTRVVGPVFGVSLFVWAALLSTALGSLAVGYFAGGALVDRTPVVRLLAWAAAAAGALLGIATALSRTVLLFAATLGPRSGPFVAATVLFAPCLVCLGMMGPIAVRLATSHVGVAGQRAGAVYAVSTAGSLAGTWTVAFGLIPNYETPSILWTTAALLCVLGALWMVGAARIAGLLLGVAVGIQPWLGTDLRQQGHLTRLERVHSPYALLDVIEDAESGVRMLRADRSVIGAQFSDGTAGFAFLHLLESLRFMRPEGRNLLQIGLGIGSLPMAMQRYGVGVDVVEIDPEVVRIAQRHFGFSTRGAVHVEDARTFLQRSEKRYDFIVHDTFTGGATPDHLLSIEVMQRIRSRLRPGGVLALAFPGYDRGPGAEPARAVMRTLRAVFPNVRAFRDGPSETGPATLSNLLFFASDRALDLRIAGNAAFESATCRELQLSMARFEILQRVDDGLIVTDSHNPLARLQLPVSEQLFYAMRELLPDQVWVP